MSGSVDRAKVRLARLRERLGDPWLDYRIREHLTELVEIVQDLVESAVEVRKNPE